MSFKKKTWVPYKRKAESIEINIKDYENQTIGFFKLHNNKFLGTDAKRIFKNIKKDYDFDISNSLTPKDEINNDIQESSSSDKSWLRKDLEW